MYKLVISDDEGKTTVVPLIRDEITIGRKEGNTIRLTERNVSRFHARVMRDNEGFVIEDLGSLCGTHVNARILRSESAPITMGDNVSIGDYSLSIRSDVSADVPMGKQMDPGDRTGIGKVTPHARLVMLAGPTPGREQDLTAELYVIGRSEEANFRIDHPSISRAHARIDLESGKWTISDLDSINGIFVNTLRKDDYVLKAGDIIRLGSVELRFVAPGEPYDFNPGLDGDAVSIVPDEAQKHKPVAAILGVIGLLIAAGLVGYYMWQRSQTEIVHQEIVEETESFDSLMEEGREKMVSQAWTEAAGLFAKALHRKPDSTEAKDLKELAVSESEAKRSFNAAIQAKENHNWKETIDFLSKIARSSRYHDGDLLAKASEKLCDELLEKASFVRETGTRADLEEVIKEIFEIPMAPARCKGEKTDILSELERRAPGAAQDGGILNGLGENVAHKPRSKRTSGPNRKKNQEAKPKPHNKAKIKNPYRDISNPYDE